MESQTVGKIADIYAVRLPPSALLTVYEALDFYRLHRGEDDGIETDVRDAVALLGVARAIHVGPTFVDEQGITRPQASSSMDEEPEIDSIECRWKDGCAAVLDLTSSDATSVRRQMQRQGWEPLLQLCPRHKAATYYRGDGDEEDDV